MKMTLYAYHEQWSWDEHGKLVIRSEKYDNQTSSNPLRIFLQEVEVELPEIELLGDSECKEFIITGLRKQKEDIQADTHMKLKAIDDKISQLLCIEMK